MKLFIFVTQILKIRKMKKIIIVLAIVNFVFTSCGNSNSTNKETELELRERELKQKEDELISEKKKALELKEDELRQKEIQLNSSSDKATVNKNQTESRSNMRIAIIDDPDGYTNVRNGMSKTAPIIDRLYEGENYEVFPSTDSNWWVVYTQSNVKGFVHKSRIKIIR